MDLVNYDKEVYNKIVSDFKAFSSKLEIKDVQFVPISALNGDNVVNRSKNMTGMKEALCYITRKCTYFERL